MKKMFKISFLVFALSMMVFSSALAWGGHHFPTMPCNNTNSNVNTDVNQSGMFNESVLRHSIDTTSNASQSMSATGSSNCGTTNADMTQNWSSQHGKDKVVNGTTYSHTYAYENMHQEATGNSGGWLFGGNFSVDAGQSFGPGCGGSTVSVNEHANSVNSTISGVTHQTMNGSGSGISSTSASQSLTRFQEFYHYSKTNHGWAEHSGYMEQAAVQSGQENYYPCHNNMFSGSTNQSINGSATTNYHSARNKASSTGSINQTGQGVTSNSNTNASMAQKVHNDYHNYVTTNAGWIYSTASSTASTTNGANPPATPHGPPSP